MAPIRIRSRPGSGADRDPEPTGIRSLPRPEPSCLWSGRIGILLPDPDRLYLLYSCLRQGCGSDPNPDPAFHSNADSASKNYADSVTDLQPWFKARSQSRIGIKIESRVPILNAVQVLRTPMHKLRNFFICHVNLIVMEMHMKYSKFIVWPLVFNFYRMQ